MSVKIILYLCTLKLLLKNICYDTYLFKGDEKQTVGSFPFMVCTVGISGIYILF